MDLPLGTLLTLEERYAQQQHDVSDANSQEAVFYLFSHQIEFFSLFQPTSIPTEKPLLALFIFPTYPILAIINC